MTLKKSYKIIIYIIMVASVSSVVVYFYPSNTEHYVH